MSGLLTTDAPVQVRDAATVVLLRDGADGLKVAMLQRRIESVFVPGAFVFPGGAVDDHDRASEWSDVCPALTDADASAAVDLPAGGLAFWVAAVRECFEEAGVLLAHHDDGAPVTFADPALTRRFDGHRTDVDRERRTLLDVCRGEGLRLDVGSMRYLSRWITPAGAPRRYDTRFFLAPAPDGQPLRHDDDETIDGLWISPADALARNEAGDFELILPTLETLRLLAPHATVAEALAAARP